MLAKWAKLDGASVLEAGAGIGMYASQIARRYSADVACFDIELERVEEARVETPHAVVAAMEAIPYRANHFDTILSHEGLCPFSPTGR